MKTFINDESGATAMEYGVITATLGAAIAVSAYYFGGMFSSMFFTLGDCIAAGFEPTCYSEHHNAFDSIANGGTPAWWPHE
jgi:Flp pilus assembly pilin Flp